MPSLHELLEAGTHFGHQTRRWNPKMRKFIFAERSGIYLIDLQKTLKQLNKAAELLKGIALKGENILFVCTKRQLKAVVEAEARNAGAHWVTERWLGGTLTNFQTIKKQIRRLRELEQGVAEGDFENYTKKEQLLFSREREKLARNLEGLKAMGRLPGAMVIIDAKKEKIAIQEANRLKIPVIAIVDTGKIASERLGLEFIDTDDLIVAQVGEPIPKLFERVGEDGFREIEAEVLRGLAGKGGRIIATGGGVVVRPDNHTLLQELGFVVWLSATVETIFERVSLNRDRPLLYTDDPLQTITSMLAERAPLYREVADLTVETDEFHAEEITHGIAASAEHFFSGCDVGARD